MKMNNRILLYIKINYQNLIKLLQILKKKLNNLK